MSEAVADVIKESASAAQVAAKPNVFPVLIAVAALVGVGVVVWRDEQRFDAQLIEMHAQTQAMQSIAQHQADTDSDLRSIGVPIGLSAHKRAMQAVSRSEGD